MAIREFVVVLENSINSARKELDKNLSYESALKLYTTMFGKCTNEFEETCVIERFAEMFGDYLVEMVA